MPLLTFCLVLLLLPALLGQSLTITAGINTSLHEIMAVFCLVFGILFQRTYLKKPLLVLFAVGLVPLFLGYSMNPINRVLRDSAPLFMMGCLFIGAYFNDRYAARADVAMRAFITLVSTLATTYLIASFSGFSTGNFGYSLRMPVCFMFIWSAQQLTLKRELQIITPARAFLVLLISVCFVVTLRTRALLLAAVVSYVVLFWGTLMSRSLFSGGNRVSFVLVSLLPILIGSALTQMADIDGGAMQRLQAGFVEGFSDPTSAFRIMAWSQALEDFDHYWLFGQGFGNYLLLDPWLRGEFQLYPSAMVHNHYVHILYVGGVLYLAAFIYFISRTRQGMLLRSNRTVSGPVNTAFLAAIVMYIGFGTALFDPLEAALIWTLVGFLSVTGPKKQSN